jgi:hypothetical protein
MFCILHRKNMSAFIDSVAQITPVYMHILFIITLHTYFSVLLLIYFSENYNVVIYQQGSKCVHLMRLFK